jgi:hypothetical protein
MNSFHDLRNIVCPRDKVNVQRTLLLKGEHRGRKLRNGIDFPGKRTGADFMVLAEDASEVTAGKEDRAGTTRSRKARFFPHVQADPGDPDLGSHAADTCFSRITVYTAATGTENTVIQFRD